MGREPLDILPGSLEEYVCPAQRALNELAPNLLDECRQRVSLLPLSALDERRLIREDIQRRLIELRDSLDPIEDQAVPKRRRLDTIVLD